MRNMGVAYVLVRSPDRGVTTTRSIDLVHYSRNLFKSRFVLSATVEFPKESVTHSLTWRIFCEKCFFLRLFFLFLLAMILRIKRYYVIFFGLAGQVVFINA